MSTQMVAIPETLNDSNWYLDSGAMNHYALDVNNITNRENYLGTDCINIGDGRGLLVSLLLIHHFILSVLL